MHILPVYLHTPIFPGIAPIPPHHAQPLLSPCPEMAGASEPTLQPSKLFKKVTQLKSTKTRILFVAYGSTMTLWA